ncbi:MAG: zinc ribbon domain-containing protein [Actinobacteria bacterium]|nr:zinc ribbon domain-containing protein [Actinomycetota bacterium]
MSLIPIYEFKCGECGCVFERLVPVAYAETPACAECGGTQVKKLFSSFGFASGGKSGFGAGCGPCTSTNCGTCGH